MIIYQLRCSKSHEFEAWFRDSKAYDAQAEAGDIVCPHCGDTSISKGIMAPNISPTRSKSKVNNSEGKNRIDGKEANRALKDKFGEALELLRSHVESSCDDVGKKFAEEARKIHYGETEKRGIYGEATSKEVAELDDEGIDFYRLPGRLRRDS
tara:strand:- start:299 stop:757 length:459 start_codon:yes stop_codon:yes gene_type:complete